MERSINLSVILGVWMGEVIRANGNFIFQSGFVESFFTLVLYLKKDGQDAQNSLNVKGTHGKSELRQRMRLNSTRKSKCCIYPYFYSIKWKKYMCTNCLLNICLTIDVSFTLIIKHEDTWQQTVCHSLSIQASQSLAVSFNSPPPPRRPVCILSDTRRQPPLFKTYLK